MASVVLHSNRKLLMPRRHSTLTPDIQFPCKKNSNFNQNEIISLNVGGQLFKCRAKTLLNKFPKGRLFKLISCSHEDRLKLCDAYFEDEKSYFYERSSQLFESIFRMYVNCNYYDQEQHRFVSLNHRPLNICGLEFIAELAFWQIQCELAPCCSYMTKPHLEQAKLTDESSIENFKSKKNNKLIRERILRFCEGDGTLASTIFTFISICFVLISVLGLVLGSIHEFQIPIKIVKSTKNFSEIMNNITEIDVSNAGFKSNEQIIWEPHPLFSYMETTCIIWFTIEYFLRIIIAPKRLSFMFQLVNIVDLIAILPFFLEMILAMCGFDVRSLNDIKGAFLVVRIMRVLRVVRILKLGRYSSGMRTFALTLRSSARQLGMMGMVLMTGVIFFSTLLYFVEKDEPQTPFTSIPAAFWWAIVTMSTVGYGDYVPVTISGQLIASGAILSGVLVLALPITIIVDNFMKVSGSFNQNVFGSGASINPFCMNQFLQYPTLSMSPNLSLANEKIEPFKTNKVKQINNKI